MGAAGGAADGAGGDGGAEGEGVLPEGRTVAGADGVMAASGPPAGPSNTMPPHAPDLMAATAAAAAAAAEPQGPYKVQLVVLGARVEEGSPTQQVRHKEIIAEQCM